MATFLWAFLGTLAALVFAAAALIAGRRHIISLALTRLLPWLGRRLRNRH